MKELLEAGVHFGHQVRRWNPKMKDYIFGERNGISIIDLQKTQRMFRDAITFVTNLAAEDRGRTIAVVDTNCSPEGIDYVIPGNDDALRAVRLFASRIADAVVEGQQMKTEGGEESEAEAAAPTAAPTTDAAASEARPRRRSASADD